MSKSVFHEDFEGDVFPMTAPKRFMSYSTPEDSAYSMPKEELISALEQVYHNQLLKLIPSADKFEARGKLIPVIKDHLITLPVETLTQKYIQAKDGGLIVSDEELKELHTRMNNSSMALEAEEERLLSAANRMKTKATPEQLYKFIIGDCRIKADSEDGIKDRDAVINRVYARLKKTESDNKPSALGKGHDPNKRYARIVDVIRSFKL